MTAILRGVLGLGGLLLLYMGAGFLIDPIAAGADFGLSADGTHGLTSMRADFTAFFGVGGACFLWGAWQRRPDPLVVGSALMLVALAARLITLGTDGSFDGFFIPMIVEAVLGVLGLIGARILPNHEHG